MKLGSAIKKCRQARNLTLEALANQAELSRSYLSLVETGKRELSLKAVERVAAVLHVPLHLLIYLAAEKRELEEMDASLKTAFDRLILDLIKDA